MKSKIGFLVAEGGAAASLKGALELLQALNVGHEKAVSRALMSPEGYQARLRMLEQRGARVIVTVGGAPTAAVMAEAFSAAPVVEVASGLLVAEVTAAVEIATMRALRILALAEADLGERLVEWRTGQVPQRETEVSTAKEPEVSSPEKPAENDDADMAELARLEREFAQNSASRQRARKGSGTAADMENDSVVPAHKPTLQQSLRYTPSAQAVFGAAREMAKSREGMEVTPAHFLGGILKSPLTAAYMALMEMGVKPTPMLEQVERILPTRRASAGGVLTLSEGAEVMLKRAKDLARAAGHRWVTTTDLLAAILRATDDRAGALLSAHGVQAHALAALVQDGRLPDEVREAEEQEPASNQPELPTEYDEEQLTRTEAMLREKLGGALTAEEPSVEVATTPMPRRPTQLEPPLEPLEPLQPLDDDAPQRIVTDEQNPQLDVLEAAMGALLEGRIVALPTETSYMLTVDATNRDAIRRLFTLTEREPGAPVGVLVHSTKQLRHMVRGFTPQLMHLTERFWPGPLTVVMERHPRSFPGVSRDATLGVRIPDNYLALALLSLIGRPLAAVTADMISGEPATTAQQVAEAYPAGIGLIVDGGGAGKLPSPTVVSVIDGKWQILREGAIPRVELDEVVPDGVRLEE